MKLKKLHNWSVTPKEAISIQLDLAKRIPTTEKKLGKIYKIAGCDVSFGEKTACAAVVVFTYPDFVLLEEKTELAEVTFPYIPTLLTFREGPLILGCLEKIKNRPDVVLFDGQGIAHPRKMGLATHMGLWMEIPTIGCAKTALYGKFDMPASQKGSHSFIRGADSHVIGAVLRTRADTKPIFVSPGYKIALKEAIKITLNSCIKYRIPEPLRKAHTLSKTTLCQRGHTGSGIRQDRSAF